MSAGQTVRRSLHYLSTVLSRCCSFRTATNRDGPKDPQPKKGGLLPLVFARQPVRRLKFLDFSPNKSRVIADVNGGLPQTQNSAFHSVTTSGDYRAENVNLTSHQESVVATTSIDSEV